MSAPVSAVLVGAGQRGHHIYGAWAQRHPDRLRFVAVADPAPDRLSRFATGHDLKRADCHEEVGALWERGRIADVCIIASPDRHHHAAAIQALQLGYQVLVEKPMAASLADTVDLVSTAEQAEGVLHVAHVLRYAPFFRALHEVLDSGRAGDIVTVEHRENVAAFHMAHSYVRGNWARQEMSTPMIVSKCCHDFDILTWNLGSPVWRLSSVGSLFEFRPELAPEGATARCTDPCPVTSCPYDARRIYLDPAISGWPVHVITDDFSEEGRLRALREGPYGLCVYTAGSDVVDNQVVTMELESGATAVLHMHGHAGEESRTMRYDGTRATVRGMFGQSQEIEIIDHADVTTQRIPIESEGGHGGGDEGVMRALVDSVRRAEPPHTGARASLESHLLAFLAEEARLTGEWIDVRARRQALN